MQPIPGRADCLMQLFFSEQILRSTPRSRPWNTRTDDNFFKRVFISVFLHEGSKVLILVVCSHHLVKTFSYLLKRGSRMLTKDLRPALAGWSGSMHPSQPPKQMIKGDLKTFFLDLIFAFNSFFMFPLWRWFWYEQLTNTIMKGKADCCR